MKWEFRRRCTICFVTILLLSILCVSCKKQEKSELQSLKIEDIEEETKEKADTDKTNSDKKGTDKTESSQTDETEKIWVYVCGAVNQPGVYTFDDAVRVYEVLERAGGLTKNAAMTYLNQAQLVSDGEQIYIPTQEEVDAQVTDTKDNLNQAAGTQPGTDDGKVNINTASREELMTLPGIGEAKAGSIISYREMQGSFQSVEEIMQIEGIKEGVYEKIKDQITV